MEDDASRLPIVSHHLPGTNAIVLIHHTRCGMPAFTDDLPRAGLEGDSAAERLLRQATGRAFSSTNKFAPAQTGTALRAKLRLRYACLIQPQ